VVAVLAGFRSRWSSASTARGGGAEHQGCGGRGGGQHDAPAVLRGTDHTSVGHGGRLRVGRGDQALQGGGQSGARQPAVPDIIVGKITDLGRERTAAEQWENP
jgi:hypothetical protein